MHTKLFDFIFFFSREFRFQENRFCCFIELKLPSFWEFSVYFDILTLFGAFLSYFFSLSSRLKCVNSFCIKFLRYWYSLQFQKPSPSAILFVMWKKAAVWHCIVLLVALSIHHCTWFGIMDNNKSSRIIHAIGKPKFHIKICTTTKWPNQMMKMKRSH